MKSRCLFMVNQQKQYIEILNSILYCQILDKESKVNTYFNFRKMKSNKERNTIYDSSLDVNAIILTIDDLFKFKADSLYIKITIIQ